VTDYPKLYRRLAEEILKHDGRLAKDAQAFVARLVEKLRAEGWQLGPEAEQALSAYLDAAQAAIRPALETAIATMSTGALSSAAISAAAEAAFGAQWPDGLTLSKRLWNWDRETRSGLEKVLRDAIRQGQSANQTVYAMQRAIERAAAGEKFKIVERYREDWVTELWQSAQTLIHDPKAKAQWAATVKDIKRHIDQLEVAGTRRAAERLFDQMREAVNAGNGDLAAKSVHWWIYDKQLYHLQRIARTEMATAGHRAVIDDTQDNPGIIGYQWRLSASHPRPDICDYYANIEMGLGKGVWTKESVPPGKAHPHCMCLLIPRATPIPHKGSQDYAQFIQGVSPERRAQLLPKWAQQLNGLGMPLEKLLREDGLGLISREALKARMGTDRFDAANALGVAKTKKNWGTRTFKAGSMTRRTLAEFAPFDHISDVKKLVENIRAGEPVDGLLLKYLKRKYPEGETIASAATINTWFDAVLSDPNAAILKRAGATSRYAVHSRQHQLLAIIEPNGQRVSVYAHDGTDLNSVWLTLNQLTQTTP
jgi:hypothetical protein